MQRLLLLFARLVACVLSVIWWDICVCSVDPWQPTSGFPSFLPFKLQTPPMISPFLPDIFLRPEILFLRVPALKKLTIFGYYRMFGYGRNMTVPYPNLDPYTKSFGVGDGYREPMLSLTVSGRPNGKSSFVHGIVSVHFHMMGRSMAMC